MKKNWIKSLLLFPLAAITANVYAAYCEPIITETEPAYPEEITGVHFQEGEDRFNMGFYFNGDESWARHGYYFDDIQATFSNNKDMNGFETHAYCLTPHAYLSANYTCKQISSLGEDGSSKFYNIVKDILGYSDKHETNDIVMKSIAIRLASSMAGFDKCSSKPGAGKRSGSTASYEYCKVTMTGLKNYYEYRQGFFDETEYKKRTNVILGDDGENVTINPYVVVKEHELVKKGYEGTEWLDKAMDYYASAVASNAGATYSGNSYLCSPAGENKYNDNQTFILEVVGEPKKTNECKDPDEPTGEVIVPTGELNKCCNDDTESVITNGKLDDLFTCDCLFDTEYYRKKANTDTYLDKTAYGDYRSGALNSDYCSLFCTGEVTIKTPESTQAGSDTYFYFKTVNLDGITSIAPITKDFESCRVRIRFDRWIKDYLEDFNNEIKEYNNYQRYKKASELYESSEEGQGKVVYKLVCTEHGYNISCGEGQNTGIGPFNGGKYEFEYTVNANVINYNIKNLNDSNNTYYKVKLDAVDPVKFTDIHSYDQLKMAYDTTGQIVKAKYEFIANKGQSFDAGYKIVADKSKYYSTDLHEVACGNKVIDQYVSCYITTDYYYGDTKLNGNVFESSDNLTLDKKLEMAKDNYENAASNLAVAINKAKDRENSLYVCQNYFGQFAGSDYETRSKFDPKLGQYDLEDRTLGDFFYRTVYQDSNGKIGDVEFTRTFERVCTTEPTVYVPDPSMYRAEYRNRLTVDTKHDLVSERYSTAFGSNKRKYIDFRCTASQESFEESIKASDAGSINASDYSKVECTQELVIGLLGNANKAADNFKGHLDTIYEPTALAMTDAGYKTTCYWVDTTPERYTLGVNGYTVRTSQEEQKANALADYREGYGTVHFRKAYTQTNTISGTYEVNWTLTNLDNKGILDNYVKNNSRTCSNTKDTNGFTCPLELRDTIISIGGCDIVIDGEVIADAESCDPKSDKSSRFNVKFKVADPESLFPTCSNLENESQKTACFKQLGYAYNWLIEDEEGRYSVINGNKKVLDSITSTPTYEEYNKTYSFTLTSTDLKAIRVYNEAQESKGGYEDDDLTCNKNCSTNSELTFYRSKYLSDPLSDSWVNLDTLLYEDSCRQCVSSFITNIYDNRIGEYKSNHKVANNKLSEVRNRNNW